MAKVILRRRAPAKQSRAPLSFEIQSEIQVVLIRLRRAHDILSALAFCADQDAELSLGPVAIAARDLIDRALDGLAAVAPTDERGD